MTVCHVLCVMQPSLSSFRTNVHLPVFSRGHLKMNGFLSTVFRCLPRTIMHGRNRTCVLYLHSIHSSLPRWSQLQAWEKGLVAPYQLGEKSGSSLKPSKQSFTRASPGWTSGQNFFLSVKQAAQDTGGNGCLYACEECSAWFRLVSDVAHLGTSARSVGCHPHSPLLV